MIIKVKTLVFCEKIYEYGDVHVMVNQYANRTLIVSCTKDYT